MEEMRADERFINRLNGRETDRMPIIENSIWWPLTVRRWVKEGLPVAVQYCGCMNEVVDIQNFGKTDGS